MEKRTYNLEEEAMKQEERQSLYESIDDILEYQNMIYEKYCDCENALIVINGKLDMLLQGRK